MPSWCSCHLMVKTQWLDAIMALWLASSKLSNSRCNTSGVCCIILTLSSRNWWLPYLKIGSGSKSSTNVVCTCITRRSSSWMWTTRCAQRRRIGGCTSMTCSSSTFHIDAKSSSTWMPMHTSSCCRPNGGRSCSSSHCWSVRSTRLSSSCRTDHSSSSNRRSRSSSSRTYWPVCSKLKASSKSMMTKRTLKTSSTLMTIGVLSTNTS